MRRTSSVSSRGSRRAPAPPPFRDSTSRRRQVMYRCEPVKNKGAYRINVIYGDPTLVYFSVLDRPRPYAVGVNGAGALTIENYTNDHVLKLSDIVNAPEPEWARVPSVKPEL